MARLWNFVDTLEGHDSERASQDGKDIIFEIYMGLNFKKIWEERTRNVPENALISGLNIRTSEYPEFEMNYSLKLWNDKKSLVIQVGSEQSPVNKWLYSRFGKPRPHIITDGQNVLEIRKLGSFEDYLEGMGKFLRNDRHYYTNDPVKFLLFKEHLYGAGEELLSLDEKGMAKSANELGKKFELKYRSLT